LRYGAILDEVQWVPELFCHLQVATDQRGEIGESILTGSQNFLLSNQISQSRKEKVLKSETGKTWKKNPSKVSNFGRVWRLTQGYDYLSN
jgi:predicted AAA+ superfamily ATPase